jgi:hypothetical protein
MGAGAGGYRDHLSQPTMWDLMSKLHMPVGLFKRP